MTKNKVFRENPLEVPAYAIGILCLDCMVRIQKENSYEFMHHKIVSKEQKLDMINCIITRVVVQEVVFETLDDACKEVKTKFRK